MRVTGWLCPVCSPPSAASAAPCAHCHELVQARVEVAAWSLLTPLQQHRSRGSTLGDQPTPLFATSTELVGQLGRISRCGWTSPPPPAHSLHEIACVNSLAAGCAAPGLSRVLQQLSGAWGTSGSRRCECGVCVGHQSCSISSATCSGSKGAMGVICRCRYSV